MRKRRAIALSKLARWDKFLQMEKINAPSLRRAYLSCRYKKIQQIVRLIAAIAIKRQALEDQSHNYNC